MTGSSPSLQQWQTASAVCLLSLTLFMYCPCLCVAVVGGLGVAATVWWITEKNRSSKRLLISTKAVLVTGCDTGFGHALAKQLSPKGVTVFAGCLSSTGEGATALRALNLPQLHVVQLDVTDSKQIDYVLNYVKDEVGDSGLWGLVNNAGLNFIGDIELTTMEQFERICNINQLGMVRVTKAILPLIRKAKGRIVNVSSVQGRMSFRCNGAYEMTKWAIENFSDVLLVEMKPFGVNVSIIEPGDFCGVTASLDLKRIKSDFDTMWHEMSPELKEVYGEEYVFDNVTRAKSAVSGSSQDVSPVMQAMEDALFTVQPKRRYLISGTNKLYDKYVLLAHIAPCLPGWFMDGPFVQGSVGGSLQPAFLRISRKQQLS